jgi:lipopolysaccharide export system protein LptC
MMAIPQPAGSRRALHPHARRHTRMVVTMRLALPALAALLLTALAVWTQYGSDSGLFRVSLNQGLREQLSMLTMRNPHFEGVDQQQRPFSVMAQKAIQMDKAGDVMELQAPEADVTMDSGAWLAINADSGRFMRIAQKLNLYGAVSLFHDQGFELHTSDVLIDLAASSAHTDRPVQGQGPSGTMTADGLDVFDGGKRVVLLGHAHLFIYGGAQLTEAPKP